MEVSCDYTNIRKTRFCVAQSSKNYVLTTGTGSGKSLSYIIPIVDFVLKNGSGKGIQAIIVYPMNALANSQQGELEKFINLGFPDNKGPVTFARYTGQESDEEKNQIMANPPDIFRLTNYVMLGLNLNSTSRTRKISKQGSRAAISSVGRVAYISWPPGCRCCNVGSKKAGVIP